MATPVVDVASTTTATNSVAVARDATWQKTGMLAEPKSEVAESTPAPTSETTTSPDVKPESESAAASEAVKPQSESKPKRSNAESRIKELLADKSRLEAQLEEARRTKQQTQAESSPAKVQEPERKAPVKPNINDFKTYQEYEDA